MILQSLLQMSRGFTRFVRDDEAMSVEVISVELMSVETALVESGGVI
jgi:hypothetical protein